MKQFLKLSAISIIAGIVLILVLRVVLAFTGNTAYVLLFNFDYIPIIKDLKPVGFFGNLFHFVTCLVSVLALFAILKTWKIQYKLWPYILVYSVGGGALFFLTALSEQPPASNDVMAWVYWTFNYAVFGYMVEDLIRNGNSSHLKFS